MYEQSRGYQQSGDAYSEPFSRQKRGLLVFLLDQSGSMRDPVNWHGQQVTLAQMATSVLNHLLFLVVEHAKVDPQTARRKDYCDLLVYGYGNAVRPLLNIAGSPVSVVDLADNPTGRHNVRFAKRNPLNNQYIPFEEEQPYWIMPVADSDYTEMAAAISTAYGAVQRWINADHKRRLSFPPVVINITDGRNNSAKSNTDPVREAMRLRQLRTDDGAVLLFNCHITQANTQNLSFPNSLTQIQQLRLSPENQIGAQQLFEMSSEVPATMALRAQQVFSSKLLPHARGFMYNASGQDLVNFLSWGTRQGQEFKP